LKLTRGMTASFFVGSPGAIQAVPRLGPRAGDVVRGADAVSVSATTFTWGVSFSHSAFR